MIRLCATLTSKLLTAAYKSKIIRFKMDEDPLQRRIYFLKFIDSLDMIFSQYRETYEVLLDYPKIGGMMLRIMQNRPSETFCIPIVMYTTEDWLLSYQKMESNVLKNCNHVVQERPLLIKVDIIGLSNRLHIKEENLKSITLRGFKMHRLCQYQ